MPLLTPIALGLLLLLSCTDVAAADEANPGGLCERLVEFRDGSILRLELPADYQFEFRDAVLTLGEEPKPAKLPLSYPLTIRFSELPALKQLGGIQQAISQLDAEEFDQREAALHTLVSGGAGFRPFIEDMFKQIELPESRARLAAALGAIPAQPGLHEHSYDEIITEIDTTKGDIGDWAITAAYRNTEIKLDRTLVRAIRQPPALRPRGNAPIIATTEPIRKDLDLLFPDDCARIDFETDSKGDPLRPGQDISRRFIHDGLLIGTSIENSFFSVNDFSVSSRSGEQSGATHEPLYRGIITLTFCVPGNEHEPAGVTHVGLYVAVVQEGGTTLAAFDASGHRIASVTTESGPHEFLGLRSNVPIHQVQVIPNTEIDEDVTIDDIVFSIPETLDAGGVENAYTLDFVTGERLVCDDFELVGNTVAVKPTGAFSEGLVFPRGDLTQIHTPTRGHDPTPAEDAVDFFRFWILLQDGSTLLAREGKSGDTPRTLLDELDLGSLPIAAIWNEDGELALLPGETRLEPDQLASIATTEPSFLKNPEFKTNMLTAEDGDATVEFLYNRLPTIWLKNPDDKASQKASGFVRLNTGERIVLGGNTAFQLKSFDAKKLTLTGRGNGIELPMESVTTLRLPKSE